MKINEFKKCFKLKRFSVEIKKIMTYEILVDNVCVESVPNYDQGLEKVTDIYSSVKQSLEPTYQVYAKWGAKSVQIFRKLSNTIQSYENIIHELEIREIEDEGAVFSADEDAQSITSTDIQAE